MNALAVTDLKQWAYCPRIVYYQHTMAGAGKPTHKMEEGKSAQDMVESLETRRTLREYGLEDARRRFGVWLKDDDLGLSGKLDLLLEGDENAAVVEFKLTSGEPGENHRMQLAGYALLVEAAAGVRVDQAFVYRIPDGKVFPVPLAPELRQKARDAIAAIRGMLESELCPEATAVRNRCQECEYANYCGDVW